MIIMHQSNASGYFPIEMLNYFTSKAPSNLNISVLYLVGSELYFLKPALFTSKDDYYATVRKVISQLRRWIIQLLQRPLNHSWTSPLNPMLEFSLLT